MYTTPVLIKKSSIVIDHSKKGLLLGSCFAEEMGSKMLSSKLPVTINPNGILFNPASIGRTFRDITQGRKYSQADLVQHGGLWHSMHHHGSFSSIDPNEVLSRINRQIDANFDYIIVTLGTSWVYQYNGEVVANCHKIPEREFKRHRLTVDECIEHLHPIAETGLPIVVTVSPVRHIKDGMTENTLSKATLRVAATELSEIYHNVHYFPSFEIVVDELRDYRYYAEDMVHPSKVAVDYIWNKFSDSFFMPETQKINSEISKLRSALDHRPLYPESDEYQKFRASTIDAIDRLSKTNPAIDFSEELEKFQS